MNELAVYDEVNKRYIDYRRIMIEQNKLPFEIEEFNVVVAK